LKAIPLSKSLHPRLRPESLTRHEASITKAKIEVIEIASYIAEMADGLLFLARSSDFHFISYLLEQVQSEAEALSQGRP